MTAAQERLADGMEDGETAAALYLAGVSMWHDAPECPCIGSEGTKSKAMTTDLVFHMALAGHFTRRPRGIFCGIRAILARIWRRWEIACAPEPWPQRNHRPSLFQPPATDRHDDP